MTDIKVYDQQEGKNWVAYHGDSCEVLKGVPENSIHLSIYSPPFADLFTYSNSDRDLGNSRDWGEFFQHYAFIIREVLRVTKPGRLTCVHTSDIPSMAVKDGVIGMKDFPGAVIRAYEAEGWIYHGYAIVPKNPQAQAIRVKSKGLAFQQLRKDASWVRPALIDRVLIFRKNGENEVPVTPVTHGEMTNETWIDWAGGVWADEVDRGLLNKPINSKEDWMDFVYAIWYGISESDVLRYAEARAQDDEKHICPLQLGTIERCVKLWSNPNETILTPFMGIGSECYQALKFGRRAVGIELKDSYFQIAVKNLQEAERQFATQDLFGYAGVKV